MERELLPMNLQFFAESGNEPGANGGGTEPTPPAAGQQVQAPEFDYEKLAGIISGKQSVAEETVLKNYFKQQGLSEDEMKLAISAYKQQKAASQPDVNALQTQTQTAQAAAQQALIEKEAVLEAIQLGIDAKTIPYVLKMADLSSVIGQDGKVNNETLKNALNKVLEDIPQLKPQAQQTAGFSFGAPGSASTEAAVDDQLNRIFGVKKN